MLAGTINDNEAIIYNNGIAIDIEARFGNACQRKLPDVDALYADLGMFRQYRRAIPKIKNEDAVGLECRSRGPEDAIQRIVRGLVVDNVKQRSDRTERRGRHEPRCIPLNQFDPAA